MEKEINKTEAYFREQALQAAISYANINTSRGDSLDDGKVLELAKIWADFVLTGEVSKSENT